MAHAPTDEYVVILDAGSQYGKVIDRRVRELHVESLLLPLDTPTSRLREDPRVKGVIISGGPSSVYDAAAPAVAPDLFTLGKPLLGICYGMQLLATACGGTVVTGAVREDGQDEITVDLSSALFEGLAATETVLLTHGDSVTEAGESLRVIARSSAGIIAAVEHRSRPLFGVQFHPEVELTLSGGRLLHNFLRLCGLNFRFTMADRAVTAHGEIQAQAAAGQRVLCLASGGVDSTVCAVLLRQALGPERVVCIHIDHGFMRLGESAAVVAALRAAGVPVTLVDAQATFAQATTEIPARAGRPAYRTRPLSEVVDPEEKRRIIGDAFMTVCDGVIADLHLDMEHLLLAQGTLRPDLIESGSSYASQKADAIKTHHNDTEAVRRLRAQGRIIEPLRDYHKDEVRELGVRLGIERALVERQPFPGPGLAIRTLCSDGTPFHEANFAQTEAQVRAVGAAAPLPASLGPLATCLLPVRTVGVQGDGRTYAYAAALSCDHLPDTAAWVHLMGLAKAIPKVAHAVNRVVFLFGEALNVSPTTVTATYLVPSVLDKLRAADDVVNRILLAHNLVRRLSQVPVILIPVGFGGPGDYAVVIRTFLTNDFMTGVPAIPGTADMPLPVLEEMVQGLLKLDFVSRVLYDLTAKPPGTTEWE